MKIFIDIGHPAHVHYFKNFIKIMKEKGARFFITARDKDVTHYLLNYYNIEFHSRGTGRKGYLGKFIHIFEADYKIFKYAKQFKPDVFLSFGSAYAAQVSKILGKPHIAFDDTDHAKYEHLMYVPFTDFIHTPEAYVKNFGKKHFRFKGIMELSYLHPKYFSYEGSKEESGKKNIIIRVVRWDASHDFGYKIKNYVKLVKFIEEISTEYQVIISSEGEPPENLRKYYHKLEPQRFHYYLKDSLLYIGESGTVANECAVLGTINILINPIAKFVGVHQYLYENGLQEYYNNFDEALPRMYYLIQNIKEEKKEIEYKSKLFVDNHIDVTQYMLDAVYKI